MIKVVDADKVEKFKVIYSSYSEVNNLDRYEDSKAERGLQALAFITLSGVTIFAASLYILTTLHKNLLLFILSYVLFASFIVLISLGTIFILYAIKPRFNIPENWNEGPKPTFPKSIFFYKQIAAMDRSTWVNFLLDNSTDKMLDKAISDLSSETHLIAEKIEKKVKWSARGFHLYLASVGFMLFMAVTMVILAISTA